MKREKRVVGGRGNRQGKVGIVGVDMGGGQRVDMREKAEDGIYREVVWDILSGGGREEKRKGGVSVSGKVVEEN